MSLYSLLRNYLSLTENFLTEKQGALELAQTKYLRKRGHSEEDIKNRTSEVRLDLFSLGVIYPSLYDEEDNIESYLGYPHSIKHEFPNLFRKSLFITVYSIFEANIHDRCKFMQKTYKLKLSVSDLYGSGLQRSKNYLEKVVGFDFSDSKEWPHILSYGKLRNCLVHNDGQVNGCQDAKFLNEYISKHNFLRMEYDGVFIKQGYCEETIEVFEKFDSFLSQCFYSWSRNNAVPQ